MQLWSYGMPVSSNVTNISKKPVVPAEAGIQPLKNSFNFCTSFFFRNSGLSVFLFELKLTGFPPPRERQNFNRLEGESIIYA